MNEKEQKYLDEIWSELTPKEQKEFEKLSDKQKSMWLRQYSEAEGYHSANPDMMCKTCKFAGAMYNGRKASSFTAGSCEKYEVKPTKVYFDGKKCPEYVEK